MINALRVDIRRYLMTKSFLLFALFVAVAQPVFMRLIMMGFGISMHLGASVDLNEFSVYSSMASIYLAVLVTMFLHAEAGEGIIRNKMISGKKRHEILLSYCTVNAALAAILQSISVLATVCVGFCTGSTFDVAMEEVVRFTGISILAGVAISIFYTVLYLCFCTTKAAAALPAVVAIIMKLVLVFVMDALYTTSGVPKVTGTALQVYRCFDRYVAFSHLTGEPRWDNMSYLVGNMVVIVISLVVGILVFRKKDMK